VPAAAGIQREQALIILTGRKGYVDVYFDKTKLTITVK